MNVRLAAVTTILVLLLAPIRFVIGEQFFPDVITTKSGEKIEGRITAESGESVTVSIETSTGRSDRLISKSEIDHILRGAPGETPTPKPTKLKQLNAPSPDKKWDYVNGDPPELLNANTSRIALEFPDNGTYYSAPLWAPDSRRFAVNYGQGVRVHDSSIYQLSGGEWKEVTTLGDDDQIWTAANKNITAQLKAKALPENIYLRSIRQSVQLHQWLDPSTAIIYAGLVERPEGENLPLVADFVLTLKFDSAGNWKIIKTRRMSQKEVKDFETESLQK
jgi:hypothetical protein